MRILKPILSMISGLLDVSLSPKTNTIHLWRHQYTPNNLRTIPIHLSKLLFGVWDFGIQNRLEVCGPTHLGISELIFENLKLRNLEKCNFGTSKHWKSVIGNFEISELYNFEISKPIFFHMRKFPAPLNIPTPIAPDNLLGGHEGEWGTRFPGVPVMSRMWMYFRLWGFQLKYFPRRFAQA